MRIRNFYNFDFRIFFKSRPFSGSIGSGSLAGINKIQADFPKALFIKNPYAFSTKAYGFDNQKWPLGSIKIFQMR
jgi:hypothetical protein